MLSRGFTLLEVLVTLVILLFGLLGIAGLMAKGQRASYEAFQRQEALALANDMAERIRDNSSGAITYIAGASVNNPLGPGAIDYTQYLNGAITDCALNACSPANLVTYDLALWDGLLNGFTESQVVGGNRIGGIIDARGCIENTGSTQAACPVPGNGVATYTQSIRISVAWQGH